MRLLRLFTLLLVLTSVSSVTSFASQPKRLKLIRSPHALTLAKAFREGKLPDPMRLPRGNIDQQAATLAKAVAAGDDSSTAALYAAILAAGYGVRDTDKSVMQTTEHGQGLLFESSEVAAMAKLYGEDYGVALGHLSDSFTRSMPALKDVPLTEAILDGIRKGAKSNQPAVRFWSQFVVALGKNSAVPYDLLAQVDPAKTRLDAVQVALILSRLSGDLTVIEKRTTGHHARSNSANQQSPCPGGDIKDLILDANALTSTTLFGILAERLGGGFATYGKVAGVANVAFTIFKFIISYASLEVEITMDGDKLIRTKTTNPGEQRLLTATLRMDTGKWQMINCLRPHLNEAGLDVDVPESGPLAGVKVEWVFVYGGDSRGRLGAIEDMFRAVGGGGTGSDAIVLFNALENAPDRRPYKQMTDSEGVSKIYALGAPQREDLSKRKLFEVDKGAGVRVDIQLKPMRIVDKKAALSNIMDIIGNALSFLTGDPVGGVVGTVTETMYRSNWYSSEPFYFIVKDWEPCTDQWTGTITYRVTSKKEGTAESNVVSSWWKEEAYYESRAQLDGRRDSLGNEIAIAEAHASEVKNWGGRGKGVCYRETEESQTVMGKTRENTTAFSISVNPRTKEYTVSGPTPVVPGAGEYSITSNVKGTCNNPFNKSFTRSSKVEGAKMSDDAPTLYGKGRIDPQNPDVISGSDSVEHVTTGGVKKTVTITWSLRRCAN